MTEQCSRCQADQPSGPDAWPTAGQPVPIGERVEEAWSRFGGQLVCPRCQNAEERQEVKYRIIGAIEDEIDRRRRDGTSTDAYEAVWVNYAMGLREDLTDQRRYGQSHLERPPDTNDRGERTHCVAFTAAFFIRQAVAVHLDGYLAMQRHLAQWLKPPQWRTEGLEPGGGTYAGPWGGGFSHALPLVIARREGADLLSILANNLRKCQSSIDGSERDEPELTLVPHRLEVEIYDLGVGVMSACIEVRSDPAAPLSEIARATKRMAGLRLVDGVRSRLADDLARIAAGVEREYSEAVTASQIRVRPDWISRESSSSLGLSAQSDAPESVDHGRLLWLHPVHLIQGSREALDTMAGELAPAFSQHMEVEGGVFEAGVGSSAVVVTSEWNAASSPLRLIKIHWAYYALYMAIDRGLLGIMHQERWNQDLPLWRLEHDAEKVFAAHLQIVDARARLDSHLASLGGDDFAIWETISDVQRFDALERAVEHKIEGLQKIAQRRVEQANAYRGRRTGDILGVLAVLTVVTVTGGAMLVLVGARTPPVLEFGGRLAFVIVALVLAAFIYWFTFMRSALAPRPSRKARRRRQRLAQEEATRKVHV